MAPLAPPRVFVGREAETAQLRELVRSVAAGRGGLLWVEGEPGIGKTALVTEGLAEGPELGCRTMWATADEMSRHAPLHAVLDCLQVDTHEASGRRARISELLHGAPGAPGITEPLWPAMEELLALVDELSTAKPLIMVMDDIQWADEASLLAWHRLAQVVEQQSLLLVAVSRPVPQREPVDRLRRSVLARDAVLLSLGPLTDAEVSALVTDLAGGPPDSELRRLADNAAGNPLYLCEMLDVLRRRHRAAPGDGPAAQLSDPAATGSPAAPGTAVPPPSLSSVITRRLDFLPPEVLETLSSATLLGQEFSVTDLAGLLGEPPSTLLSPLRYAIAAGVVGEHNASCASGTRSSTRHCGTPSPPHCGWPCTARPPRCWTEPAPPSSGWPSSSSAATPWTAGRWTGPSSTPRHSPTVRRRQRRTCCGGAPTTVRESSRSGGRSSPPRWPRPCSGWDATPRRRRARGNCWNWRTIRRSPRRCGGSWRACCSASAAAGRR